MCVHKIFCFIIFFGQALAITVVNYSGEVISRNSGDISFVTPFIKSGNITGGQNNCSVKPMKDSIVSYAGFFTVRNDARCKSNLFFWFFPSQSGSSAPVILRLQGSPISSSFAGVFEENGPFYVKPKRGLKLRKYSWIQTASVLYVDSSVGTGYSFTSSDDCYAKNKDDVSADLLEAVKQFFTLFPQYQGNDFFISGESYGAKYVVTLAYVIDHNNNLNTKGTNINLKGVSLGNGFCDPLNMVSYSKYFYEIGLIDMDGLKTFQTKEKEIVSLIQSKKYDLAYNKFDELINGDLSSFNKTLFYNLTGFTSNLNYWFANSDSQYGSFEKFIQSDIARRAIHVGSLAFNTDNKVEKYQLNDIMQSVKPLIEQLLNKKYQVLIYSGQSDIIIPYPVTINFVRKLNWSGAIKFLTTAKRKYFLVQTNIAGYFKKADNLIQVLIRDAGHRVTKDQPLWVLKMITSFTSRKQPFFGN